MFKLHLTSELKEAFISLTAKQMEGYRTGHPAAAFGPPLKKMVLYEKQCTGCSACAVMCPAHAISVSDNKKHRNITIAMSSCMYCGVCTAICPEKALELQPGSDLPATVKEKLYHELKIKLKGCEHCQTTIGTVKGIAKTVQNSYSRRGVTQKEIPWILLCTACKRKFHGKNLNRPYAQ